MDENKVVPKKPEKRLDKTQLFEKRCREILDAARHVFAGKGFRCTKIDDIAAYLKVGKGTIYRYFNDKESLFVEVYEDGMRQLRDKMYSIVDPVANPTEKIRSAVKTYFEFFDANPELVEITMQVRSEFKDDYQRVFLELYHDYIVRIQGNLRSGVEQGVFRQLDVEKTAEVISATLQGVLQSFYMRESGGVGKSGSRKKLTDISEAVWRFMLEGLLSREQIKGERTDESD